MQDSSRLTVATQRNKLDVDGYLLIRNAIPSVDIEKARSAVMNQLHQIGAIRSGTDHNEGYIEYREAWNNKQHIHKHRKTGKQLMR